MYNSITAENRVPSLKDQLDNYYNLKLNFDPAETVYAFWFGTQDIFEMAKRHGKHEPDYKEITDCIGQQLVRTTSHSNMFIFQNILTQYYRELLEKHFYPIDFLCSMFHL